LRGGSPGNHGSRGILDLHLMEQHLAVLGQLNVTCTTHKPEKKRKRKKKEKEKEKIG